MTLEDLGIAASAVLAAAGIAALAVKWTRSGWRAARRLGHLVDEVLGVEAHGSRPAVPGWAERLDRIQDDIVKIKMQVFPNGGSSLRDAVDDVRKRLDDHLGEAEQTHKLFVEHLGQHPTTVVQVAAPTPPALPGSK